MSLPYPPSTAEYVRARSRRSRIRNGAILVASSVSSLVGAPILLDSSRTIRSLIKEMKAPRTNDMLIQKALANIKAMNLRVETIGEVVIATGATDSEGSVANFMWELQALSDFLQESKARFEVLQTLSYGVKLANQREIANELSNHEQELADRKALLDVSLQNLKESKINDISSLVGN
ncbi:hypothetical protein RhiJN_28897 [Ceratobasidium sp. AG-Ba]|nr:hypothetical protein RhiJN_28897 [Ceratobasidium sp. AG-Ba]